MRVSSRGPPAWFGGILVACFYLVASILLTPQAWADPLGAMVKTIPAIVLMIVGLALLEDR